MSVNIRIELVLLVTKLLSRVATWLNEQKREQMYPALNIVSYTSMKLVSSQNNNILKNLRNYRTMQFMYL